MVLLIAAGNARLCICTRILSQYPDTDPWTRILTQYPDAAGLLYYVYGAIRSIEIYNIRVLLIVFKAFISFFSDFRSDCRQSPFETGIPTIMTCQY